MFEWESLVINVIGMEVSVIEGKKVYVQDFYFVIGNSFSFMENIYCRIVVMIKFGIEMLKIVKIVMV